MRKLRPSSSQGLESASLLHYSWYPIRENQMEKKMENEMETLGPLKGVYRDITPIMENQMEKKMENEMETWVL